MSNFTPLTGEEKEIKDSIVALTLKEKLEFFVVPIDYREKLETGMAEIQPFLTSESKIEVAIASDCYYKLSTLSFILNLLSDGQ